MHTKRRVVKGYKRFIMASHYNNLLQVLSQTLYFHFRDSRARRISSLQSGEQTSISIPKLGSVGFGVVKLTCDQGVLLPRKQKSLIVG